MRRSGKTTRLINEAIEILFKEKIIYIPTKQGIRTPNKWESKADKFNLIDPDYSESNMAQEDFIRRIFNRAMAEHPGQIEIDRNTYRVKFTIKV
ncbi:MAG: hypothetical protein KG003_10040 [Bacteroidetes bacterium]|nr:hypothetical protein [Bacteroidota bacterium]